MNKPEAKRILNEVLGYFKESGQELLFKCPSCNHHKPKLSVNLDKNVFKCWTCHYRGRNLRRLVRRYGSYIQLSKWDKITNRFDLANFADLFMDQSDCQEEIKVELPEQFKTLTSRKLPIMANPAYRYLRERGVTRDDILRWKIGFCFDGQYRNRIIIPSFNDDGDTNYFIARSYSGDSYKYKNPRASKNIVFNELFVDWDQDLVIVEGVFDAIVAGNAVPILGSTLPADSRLIQKIVYNDTPVYIALDPDAEAKERRIIKTLLRYDIELYKIDVSGYEDVGSMPKEIFQRRKQQASFIDNDNYLLMNLLMAI